MIVTASQRANGAELARHVLDLHSNEEAEQVEIRGAVARDLSGAIAEWGFQAEAFTRCKNPFYSVSINPDPAQPDLSREQIFEFLGRIEKTLNLSNQPRAIVRHVKDGRQHWHVIYSRVDVENRRAVHLAFDHLKVRKEQMDFAHDHGLELPRGFFEHSEYSAYKVYDRAKQAETGLSLQDHKEQVADAWRQSDSARAFLRALQERGYILATGDRPYVLVDVYGDPRALPRLLGDEHVRQSDVEKFLERHYPIHDLPSVEEAQEMVAEFASTHRALAVAEHRESALTELAQNQKQDPRRTTLEARMQTQAQRHHAEREALAAMQRLQRQNQKSAFRAQQRFIRTEREARRPKGLAHFLGKVTGINLVREKFYKYQDRKRLREFLQERRRVKVQQAAPRETLKQKQILEKRPLEREMRAVVRTENDERRKLKREIAAEQRTLERGGSNRMPSVRTARGKDLTEKDDLVIETNTASGSRTKLRRQGELEQEFARTAEGDAGDGRADGEAGTGGDSSPEKPTNGPDKPRRRRRKRDRGKDYDRGR